MKVGGSNPAGATPGDPDSCTAVPVSATTCQKCSGNAACRAAALKKIKPADLKVVAANVLNREVENFHNATDNGH